MDVSDIQLLASHAVCPIRIWAVDPINPKSDPSIEIEKCPATIRLDPVSKEGRSTENSSVTLPDCRPSVAESRLVPISACRRVFIFVHMFCICFAYFFACCAFFCILCNFLHKFGIKTA